MKSKQLAAIAALSTLSLVVACSGGSGGAGGTGGSMLPVPPMSATDSLDDIANAKSKVKVTPRKLAFAATGAAAAKKITASEKNYKGVFTIVSTCGKSIKMKPKKAAKGPSGTFTVTPVDAVTCSLTISDKAKNKATVSVVVKLPSTPTPSPSPSPTASPTSSPAGGIVNGNFATGKLAPWTPCSFSHPGYANPVNASPPPAGTGAQATTPTAPISLANVTKYGNSVGTPPPNYNPSGALPTGLSSNAAMTGDQFSEQIGASGICQTFTVPSNATYLSFWAYEGGSEYAFYFADQEADVMTADGTAIQKTLFAEDNCFWNPGHVGATGYTNNGCIPPSDGSTSSYQDFQGGAWVQRGPYNLSAYAGKSITLYLGTWSSPSVNEVTPYPATYSNEMWVTNVQMSGSSTFPSATMRR
jgi:hypothetical protein